MVPTSARLLAALAAAVFLLPLTLVVALGATWPYVPQLVGLLSAAVCAVPVFYRRRNPFRVACAAAGFTVAAVWVPLAILCALMVATFGGWAWLLFALLLPAAAITALIAAFQRARGAECGRVAVALGRAMGALSLLCWGYVMLR
ncbi:MULTISPECIES: hypothetical protein [unclassified Kitasatospora]|uniref:hypothetical protein n=1 Tax=unclassified Kitasatospora TaxID=2633591 RepID=UPI00344A5FD6